MKEAYGAGKENKRQTQGGVVRPEDDEAAPKKERLKEADGIIHGDAKKAGEAVIQNDKKASS
jgi:hypothetical protein